MIGAVGAAVILINRPEIGGLTDLVSNPAVTSKISMLPDFSDNNALWTLLILPLAVQWWSVWYPGSEPGGGGYIAQRMLSAKNEGGAVKATLFFNIAHYALRPWPWILVALASLIVFPDLMSLQQAFPNVDPDLVKHDLAYPAMMSLLPHGFLGLVVASLIAAFMSTVSTQLNWGASYVVHDFYRRFMNPEASDKKLVMTGRIVTIILMILAGGLALLLQNALGAFNILLQVGAGTGLIFILRWFWWRINAYSELTAMIVSFVVALFFQFIYPLTGLPELTDGVKLVSGVGFTTVCWLIVTFTTKPEDTEKLRSFTKLVQPGGPGWKKIDNELTAEGEKRAEKAKGWDVPSGILCMLWGTLMVYAALFSFGYFLYGMYITAISLTGVTIASALLLNKARKKLVIR
jgi:Na+/proline symporter